MQEIIKKTCKCCNKEFDLSFFYIKNKKTGALRGICKKCWYLQSIKNKEKNKEKNKQYYIDYAIKNKNKIIARTNKWREKNKDLIAKKSNARYNDKIDIIKKYNNKYYIKNKETIIKKITQYSKTPIGRAIKINIAHNRRLLFKNGDVDNNELKKIIGNAKSCYWCGCNLKNVKIHIDHYEPLSKGGKHTISNLVVSCQTCNLKKGSKDPFEFSKSIGRLV